MTINTFYNNSIVDDLISNISEWKLTSLNPYRDIRKLKLSSLKNKYNSMKNYNSVSSKNM